MFIIYIYKVLPIIISQFEDYILLIYIIIKYFRKNFIKNKKFSRRNYKFCLLLSYLPYFIIIYLVISMCDWFCVFKRNKSSSFDVNNSFNRGFNLSEIFHFSEDRFINRDSFFRNFTSNSIHVLSNFSFMMYSELDRCSNNSLTNNFRIDFEFRI